MIMEMKTRKKYKIIKIEGKSFLLKIIIKSNITIYGKIALLEGVTVRLGRNPSIFGHGEAKSIDQKSVSN